MPQTDAPWYDALARTARDHGALPYVVEGFTEIVDAVRRGHAVLVRRERCEVAEGIVVFDEDGTAMSDALAPASHRPSPADGARDPSRPPVVAILRFDPGTARFILQDPAASSGAVQLTPRRLQRYLAEPEREVGVALGAA